MTESECTLCFPPNKISRLHREHIGTALAYALALALAREQSRAIYSRVVQCAQLVER